LVSASTNAGIIGAKARLPIHGVVGNASLVVVSAGRARGEGDSVTIPGAILFALIVIWLADLRGPPFFEALVEVN
jgi:hypothetical protein